MVCDVLAQRQFSVAVQSGEYFKIVEEVFHDLRSLFETLGVCFGPPVAQVAVFVELRALVIEAVGHFVADDHPDGSIVAGVVGIRLEERRLQDAGGETNLVGGGIVVGIDGLRCHQPFVSIDAFVHSLFNVVVTHEAACSEEVFIETEFVVDVQFGIVHPGVGIANFDAEGVEFFVCFLFGFRAHPFLCVDSFAECVLEVADEFRHALFGSFGEVFFHIDFSNRHAKGVVDDVDASFPSRFVLFGAAHGVLIEVEGGFAEAVGEGRGSVVEYLISEINL